jgi:hypothetical protein
MTRVNTLSVAGRLVFDSGHGLRQPSFGAEETFHLPVGLCYHFPYMH